MGADNQPHVALTGQAQAATIPPRELIERTGGGHKPEQSDELFIREFYERTGRDRKAGIIEALPDGYSFEGRRVLDFGCGSGRVLHAFLPEAASGEFWGCDLHRPTIAWLDQHLSPPLSFFVNDEIPTPHQDSYFDLVYAISVFTHITHQWSAWLLELHRILKPDGLLLATIIGPESWGHSLGKPPEEDQLGMCVQQLGLRPGDQSSGARVLHSPWWLRAHWGRAFEILSLRSSGFAVGWHGFALGRKKGVSLTRDDLERPEPKDPRELEAQRQQLVVLEQEAVEMGARWEDARARVAEQAKRLRDQAQRLRQQAQQPREQAQRQRDQQKLLRAMLESRAFAVAEQLSRLRQRGRPLFSRQQIRRALGDQDGSV